jgi:colanic acid biosynthesis protein WcaH
LKLVGSEPLGPVEGFVPNSIFTKHEHLFPKVTVDIIVAHARSFLLVRRSSKNSSGRGLWATVGGHVRKNETLENAAVRILERETGITADMSKLTFIGVNQYFDKQVHCVSMVFKITARSKSVVLDETSSEYGWFTSESCPPSTTSYYRTMLRLGGFGVRSGNGSAE